MPRVNAAPLPGCPPIRIIAADELGFIKVVEAHASGSAPQVVARWGEADKKRAVSSLSLLDNETNTLAAGRQDGTVEFRDLATGALQTQFNAHEGTAAANGSTAAAAARQEGGKLCFIHMLRSSDAESSRALTCTEGGTVCVRHIIDNATELASSSERPMGGGQVAALVAEFAVLKSTNSSVVCAQVGGCQTRLAVGGKGEEISVWDIGTMTKAWAAKSPKPDSLGLVPPPWATALTYMSQEDSRKVAVGTAQHTLRLYDVAAQRRPIMTVPFGDAPIRALAAGAGGHSMFLGNGTGQLAEFDLRTGKMVSGFKGAQAGSIRSIARHSSEPLLASCGLDRFLRIHSTATRQLLGRVFLKQPLVAVLFDMRANALPTVRGTTAAEEEGAKPAGEPVEDEGREENVTLVQKNIHKRRKQEILQIVESEEDEDTDDWFKEDPKSMLKSKNNKAQKVNSNGKKSRNVRCES